MQLTRSSLSVRTLSLSLCLAAGAALSASASTEVSGWGDSEVEATMVPDKEQAPGEKSSEQEPFLAVTPKGMVFEGNPTAAQAEAMRQIIFAKLRVAETVIQAKKDAAEAAGEAAEGAELAEPALDTYGVSPEVGAEAESGWFTEAEGQ